MSAEVLRQAAKLMRERAEDASPASPRGWGVGWKNVIATTHMPHVRSWHPVVALAVADWLEAEATSLDSMASFSAVVAPLVREEHFTIRGAALTVGQDEMGAISMTADTSAAALAAARAYIGSNQ